MIPPNAGDDNESIPDLTLRMVKTFLMIEEVSLSCKGEAESFLDHHSHDHNDNSHHDGASVLVEEGSNIDADKQDDFPQNETAEPPAKTLHSATNKLSSAL